MKARNGNNGNELADNVVLADSAYKRLKGLLGRSCLEKGEALLIRPCMSIHTVAMRFPIDVLFLDSEGVVIAKYEAMAPYRFTSIFFKAKSVLELPSGTLSQTNTNLNDPIILEAQA